MTTTLTLLAVILGLLLALEIANALFDSVFEGLAIDAARKEPVPFWLVPPMLGRSRVVLLKNGGFAQARPWADWRPAQIVFAVGTDLGLGVICMGPIIIGSALLVTMLVITTSIEPPDLLAFGHGIAIELELVRARELAVVTGHAVADAKWWTWPIAIVVSLLLAPNMTPSTVDWVIGRAHLLAYGIATLACTAVAARAPAALWLVAPAAGAIGIAGTWFAPKWARALWAGTGLATAVLALALAVIGWRTSVAPLVALHTALGVITYAFGVAALMFTLFVIGFLALSLIAIRPRTLWYTLRAVPRHLIDLVRTFNTCETCKVHYRGTCDGCGRTPVG